jgi:hypothetical protein
MIKMLYLAASLAVLVLSFPAMGEGCEGCEPGILYILHYENGTVLNITEDSRNYSELNSSTMEFLEYIVNRIERAPTSEELEKELAGTSFLVLSSEKPMQIQTKQGLNPDWPQGWTITTKKIVIKLQKDVLGEERIFTYHEPEDVGAPIRPWSSAASVDTIKLP